MRDEVRSSEQEHVANPPCIPHLPLHSPLFVPNPQSPILNPSSSVPILFFFFAFR